MTVSKNIRKRYRFGHRTKSTDYRNCVLTADGTQCAQLPRNQPIKPLLSNPQGSSDGSPEGLHCAFIVDLRIFRTEAPAIDNRRPDQCDKAGTCAAGSIADLRREAQYPPMDRCAAGSGINLPDEPCGKEGRY